MGKERKQAQSGMCLKCIVQNPTLTSTLYVNAFLTPNTTIRMLRVSLWHRDLGKGRESNIKFTSYWCEKIRESVLGKMSEIWHLGYRSLTLMEEG